MKYKQIVLKKLLPYISQSTAERIALCGSWLSFDEEGRTIDANFCKHRFCPVCNYLESRKRYAQNLSAVQAIGGRYLFLTVTVKNCEPKNLSKTLDDLNISWHRYSNHKWFGKTVNGYFKSLEITYNDNTHTFHPHIHALMSVNENYFTENFISAYEWRKKWELAANLDYSAQVKIKTVPIEEQENAAAEISKYCCKLSSVVKNGGNDFGVLVQALRGRKLINCSGVFRGLEQVKEPEENHKIICSNMAYQRGIYTPINVETLQKITTNIKKSTEKEWKENAFRDIT